jgi:predicted amidophosphoribosyltransferase
MEVVRALAPDPMSFLISPRAGRDVCVDCFNLTAGFNHCYRCAHGERHLDAMVPISYSIATEPLHQMLAGYKRTAGPVAEQMTRRLAGILWRFLIRHEACLARAAGVAGFDLVTTVPSSDPERDEHHPLRRIVGELVDPTRGRHERLLVRTARPAEPRHFDRDRYESLRDLNGSAVLLIDDTWTTGASAHSAAAVLKSAGARTVAGLVLGRHLNREWHDNDRHLGALPGPFSWDDCALCSDVSDIRRAA